MRRLILLVGLLPFAATGCGGSPTLNTEPLTAEQQQKIKEADQQVEQDESHGQGAGFKGKKKR